MLKNQNAKQRHRLQIGKRHKVEPTTREKELLESQNVSRETFLMFSKYVELLIKWNKTINLVSPATIKEVWMRHIIDSAQVYPHIVYPQERILVDIGSGAGFPGLVLAAMGVKEAHMIESDSRKCSFMREVARKLPLSNVEIHNVRIEAADLAGKADIVSARALAPLEVLLGYAEPLLKETGECFFLKGENWEQELTAATAIWQFKCRPIPSLSSNTGIILQISGFKKL